MKQLSPVEIAFAKYTSDWDKVTARDFFEAGYEAGRQAQHEATWAMAMEKAENAMRNRLGIFTRGLEELREIPCPPLQTTNEKCEK